MAIDPYSALLVANNIGTAFGARDPRSFGATLGVSGGEMIKGIMMQQELERQRKAKEDAEKGGVLGEVGAVLGTVAGSAIPGVGPIVGPAIGSALGGAAGTLAGGGEINPLDVGRNLVTGGMTGALAPVQAANAGVTPGQAATGQAVTDTGRRATGMATEKTAQLGLSDAAAGASNLSTPAAAVTQGATRVTPGPYDPVTVGERFLDNHPRLDNAVNTLHLAQQVRQNPSGALAEQATGGGYNARNPQLAQFFGGIADALPQTSRLFGDASAVSFRPRLGLGPAEVGQLNQIAQGDQQIALQQAQLGLEADRIGVARAKAEADLLAGAQPDWDYNASQNLLYNNLGDVQYLQPNPLLPGTLTPVEINTGGDTPTTLLNDSQRGVISSIPGSTVQEDIARRLALGTGDPSSAYNLSQVQRNTTLETTAINDATRNRIADMNNALGYAGIESREGIAQMNDATRRETAAASDETARRGQDLTYDAARLRADAQRELAAGNISQEEFNNISKSQQNALRTVQTRYPDSLVMDNQGNLTIKPKVQPFVHSLVMLETAKQLIPIAYEQGSQSPIYGKPIQDAASVMLAAPPDKLPELGITQLESPNGSARMLQVSPTLSLFVQETGPNAGTIRLWDRSQQGTDNEFTEPMR